jgi:hypothetical protein
MNIQTIALSLSLLLGAALAPGAEEFRLPKDTQRIDAPTPYVWIIGRTKTDGPADYAAVNKIQARYKVTPRSDWDKTPKPVEVKIDASIDMKTPPVTRLQPPSLTAQ